MEPFNGRATVDNFSAVVVLLDAYFLSSTSIVSNPASSVINSLKADNLSTIRMFDNGHYVKYEYKKTKYV